MVLSVHGSIQVTGSNGFSASAQSWNLPYVELAASDPGPGQTGQPATYTATAVFVLTYCQYDIFLGDCGSPPQQYLEQGQGPPATVQPLVCTTQVTPASADLWAGSGSVAFAMALPGACPWTAPATSGFLTRTSAGSGTGPGTVTYSYPANPTGTPRSTSPVIAGQTVSVTQAGAPSPNEQISYLHLDAIGSVRAVTTGTGAVVSRHDYLPYGQELPPDPAEPRLRFAGQEHDPETDQDYFGARYYLAQLERFTQPDPVTITAARLLRPDRLNRYTYANLNPFRFTDPDGLDACEQDYVSEECNGWWHPCPGWLIVPGLGAACGWNEGLLSFDGSGYLAADFRELGEANWLTRRGTPPITLGQIADLLAHIPPGRPLTACEKATLAPYHDATSLEDARLHFTGLPWYLRLGMKLGIANKDTRAITRGNEIYFRTNAYNPGTVDGLALLSHEVYHVWQYREAGMNWWNYLWDHSPTGRWEGPAYTHRDNVRAQLAMGKFAGCPSN